jgi:hypothetical protein
VLRRRRWHRRHRGSSPEVADHAQLSADCARLHAASEAAAAADELPCVTRRCITGLPLAGDAFAARISVHVLVATDVCFLNHLLLQLQARKGVWRRRRNATRA